MTRWSSFFFFFNINNLNQHSTQIFKNSFKSGLRGSTDQPFSQPQMDSFDISELASEILLFILLHLDLNQLVICRRVNKQFLEIIDNNQLLWRVFEWIEQDQESFRPALEMFDQKSRSSLEKISIQGQNSKDEDRLHLGQVLKRSTETLGEVTLKIPEADRFGTQVVELVAAGSRLRRLIVWDWGYRTTRASFPLSRLISSGSRGKTSSVGQLQLLWIYSGVAKVDSKHLNSLISFAQCHPRSPQKCRELISDFSETVVHLRLEVENESSTIKPLFCPNLKVFEGWVTRGVSSFLDAPQLQILILEDVMKKDLTGLPPSVEEIWLRNRIGQLDDSEDWEPLLRHCPKLRILKLTEDFVSGNSAVGTFIFTGILEMLEIRKKMARDGEEIDGIKIVFLEKLILPPSKLNEKELKRAAEVAEEIIDVKNYPEFIEIQY